MTILPSTKCLGLPLPSLMSGISSDLSQKKQHPKKNGSSRAAKVAVWNLLRCFMNWGFSWSSHQLLGLWDLVVEVMKLARHLELWTKPLLWNLHHLVFQKACTVEIAHQKDPFGNHSDCKRWQSNRIKRTRINHSQSPIALRWDSTCLTYLAWTSNCF